MKILAIESSCDDTSVAVVDGVELLSSVISSQAVHEKWGGVVPELASRAHCSNIVPTLSSALHQAGVTITEIDAIAFTRGPGLLGSLLVGISFAKGLSVATGKPLIEVNHLRGHILSLFLKLKDKDYDPPKFPFLCLLVSGGHTQIVKVSSPHEMEIVGSTIDDAAGEAFDKCAKVMGLPYPGGPHVDRLAAEGNPERFSFARPRVGGLDFSFSGLKTSFLYTVQREVAQNPNFIEENLADLCASLQHTIISILIRRIEDAVKKYGITEIGLGGGVSANSGLRNAFVKLGEERGYKVHIPERFLTTDNAAMIGVAGYYKALRGEFAPLNIEPKP